MIPQKHQKAKKSLGQNFLTDEPAISAIVDCIEVKKTDTLVEIGPGHGELTEKLLAKRPEKLIAIEKDHGLAQKLVNSLAISHKNLEIIDGDALGVIRNSKLEIRNSTSWKLVGNIPYYITGFLLRTIGELENKPEVIVLTIQKEVAERICAQPKKMNPVRDREGSQRPSVSNGMNLLAASVQVWGRAEIAGLIDRESFDPVPKVDSAIIKITPFKQERFLLKDEVRAGDLTAYYKTIKILFQQPRKTILNNLRSESRIMNYEYNTEELKNLLIKNGIDPSLRPQNLNIEDILKISDLLK